MLHITQLLHIPTKGHILFYMFMPDLLHIYMWKKGKKPLHVQKKKQSLSEFKPILSHWRKCRREPDKLIDTFYVIFGYTNTKTGIATQSPLQTLN